MAKVLVTRLSSFGDVVMLVPVIFSVAARYPQDRFVVLTRKAFAPLFENLGFNISAVTFDPARKHKGFLGTLRLQQSILKYGYTHVADVHDVLRTKLIRTSMMLMFGKTAYIDKGRSEKRNMIETKVVNPPLTPTYKRYMDVFEKLGFPAEMVFKNFFEFSERSLYPLRAVVSEKKCKWVGIAPFSKHAEKIYPLSKMEKVISELSKNSDIEIFLFGSGVKETDILEKWADNYPNVKSVSGKLNLINELMLISYLDVMVSMDSANMHLASIVQTPVVSIWGSTHPNLGFYGFRQDIENVIQADLSCRPCSVFGDIPCARKDLACLNEISEASVVSKIESILSKESREHIDLEE